MKKEEIDAHFKDFDRMGEKAVRIAVYSGEWRNNLSRFGAASEWLRLKDLESQSRSSKYARIAAYAATIAAIAAIIAAREDIIWLISWLLKQIAKGP